MSAILKSLNVHIFPIFKPILMKLVSKSIVYRPLSYNNIIRVAAPFNRKYKPLASVPNFKQFSS